MESTR